MELEHRVQRIDRMLPPRRRLWMEMAVHADDLPTLVDAVRVLLHDLEKGCPGAVWASPSFGAHFKVKEDPEVTPCSYQEALTRYLEMIREEKSVSSEKKPANFDPSETKGDNGPTTDLNGNL
ncbi:MAG: hypothetical protein E6Q76_03705 [Rhizobium sp.]|nr:MAG: hypothetical protein E6Q76_03705 [Rhizobium sp.]